MSITVTVEVCTNGTITRACARTINAQLRKAGGGSELSGTTDAAWLVAWLRNEGVTVRVVEASKLAGPDKARHTREVTRSRKAQVRREARKAEVVEAPAPTRSLTFEAKFGGGFEAQVRPLPHKRPMPFARVA